MGVRDPGSDPTDVLRLVHRYRVMTEPALMALWKRRLDTTSQLQTATGSRLVVTSRSLPGSRGVIQLTRKGAAALGLQESEARLVGPQALLKHLGVLQLCASSTDTCSRLLSSEADELIDGAAPEGVHVVLKSAGVIRMGWAYVPAPNTGVDAIARRLRDHAARMREHRVLGRWMEERRYVGVVVVDHDLRAQAVERVVRRHDRRFGGSVQRVLATFVRHPPGLAELFGASPKRLWRSNKSLEEGP
jgi:hypothetical protein